MKSLNYYKTMFDCEYFTLSNTVEYLHKNMNNDEIVDYLTDKLAMEDYY